LFGQSSRLMGGYFVFKGLGFGGGLGGGVFLKGFS
jgi:hypothetical protein